MTDQPRKDKYTEIAYVPAGPHMGNASLICSPTFYSLTTSNIGVLPIRILFTGVGPVFGESGGRPPFRAVCSF
jgi:hypothetical protein